VRRASRYEVRAISGLDRFDRRSEMVREIQRLAAAVARSGEPLWAAPHHGDLPDQLQAPLDSYLDQSPARTLAVLPLAAPEVIPGRPPAAVLVLERFAERGPSEGERSWIGLMARHSQLALGAALRLARVPWLLRAVGGAVAPLGGGRFSMLAATLALLLGGGAALALVPTDFDIECRGMLQPVVRRDVFAPVDGSVRHLLVTSGDRVDRGTPLIELENSELELEMARVLGESNTARTELLAVQASLSAAARGDDRERRAPSHELAAEEERLKGKLQSLDAQRLLLERWQGELVVTSPIDGEVLTWDLQQRLAARPVRRGQRLVTIADPDGPWQLELGIADRDLGHVLAARMAAQESDSALPVRFLLASRPGEVHAARLTQIGQSSEITDQGESTVTATARIEIDRRLDLRAGAQVVARIHCGRRSLAFVWLRDVWEIIRLRTFW
jgi:multidrug efflux pump subunit AcrA (membrane-fusion protein)